MVIQSPTFVPWLIAIPIVAFIYYYGLRKRRHALTLWQGSHKAAAFRSKRGVKLVLQLVALSLLGFALLRPAWNMVPQVVRSEGRDVVFLLDVSKSMLAEDLPPTRLQTAKIAIEDTIEVLAGDRVSLVAFAGEAIILSPLTLDYGFFKMMLRSASPESVNKGGTLIGDALRRVVDEVFDSQDRKYKDVVLITDGEDHESFPVEAAKYAAQQGVRIIAIGLGEDKDGARIPQIKSGGEKFFATYKGKEVWSKLDSATLKAMVNETQGGQYFHVATAAIDLGSIYRQLIRSAQKRGLEDRTVQRYEEVFQYFIIGAFLLLLSDMFIAEVASSVLLLILVGLSTPSFAHADGASELASQAYQLYESGDYDGAAQLYHKARKATPDSERLIHNEGVARYKKGEYERASELFAKGAKKDYTAKNLYNRGNALYRLAEQSMQKDASTAKKLLQESMNNYRQAYRRDSSFTDAAYNLEVVHRKLQQLEQLQKEKQNSPEQQKENSPEQEKSSEQNTDESNQNQQKSEKDESQSSENDGEKKQDDKQSGQQQQEEDTQQDEHEETTSEPQADEELAVAPDERAEDIVNQEVERMKKRRRLREQYYAVERDW